ncbi:MAG: hypothetical protein RBS37_07370 [Bacteroidales bacterium]|jgi:hypothetical protein|nr:hypothetical protein [Bacteroidales bacterium]
MNSLMNTGILLTLLLTWPGLPAQQLQQAGNSTPVKPYIEYLPGELPLIISIPHGGYLIPDEIPDRPCTDCAKNQDIYTLEIGLRLREEIYLRTGSYPHVIISHLHRTRLDPNRNITEAASGNSLAEEAWHEFHNLIDSARNRVARDFGKGLYIDLHGHRHELKRTEIGYLFTGEELQLDDEMLDFETFVEYSSIRNLVAVNVNRISHTGLLRGESSLGAMFEKHGYPAVPSPVNPFPKTNEPYFPGGYDTRRHGSSSGGTIDGIQIELDLELRSDETRRNIFAADLADILISYITTHYFPDIFLHDQDT